jgi:hypothetical protein
VAGGWKGRTPEELRRFDYGEVAFWCDNCGLFELDPEQASAHAKEFGHTFEVERDWFKEGNEELFAWDRVAVADDDRTLTFSGIHAPEWIAGPHPTRWGFSRVEFEPSDDAVGARVWLVEQRPNEPDALDGDDPHRTVTAKLGRPLAGRIVYDHCAWLRTPQAEASSKAVRRRWQRVQRAGERALVVYWEDAGGDVLDHVSVEWSPDELLLGVWVIPSSRMSATYNATIVRLDRPLGDRRILRQRRP